MSAFFLQLEALLVCNSKSRATCPLSRLRERAGVRAIPRNLQSRLKSHHFATGVGTNPNLTIRLIVSPFRTTPSVTARPAFARNID